MYYISICIFILFSFPGRPFRHFRIYDAVYSQLAFVPTEIRRVGENCREKVRNVCTSLSPRGNLFPKKRRRGRVALFHLIRTGEEEAAGTGGEHLPVFSMGTVFFFLVQSNKMTGRSVSSPLPVSSSGPAKYKRASYNLPLLSRLKVSRPLARPARWGKKS